MRLLDSLGGKRPSGKMSAHACDARENLRAQTNKEWEWQYFHASYLHISPLWVITRYHETGKSKACYQSGTRWCTCFRRNVNKTFAMMTTYKKPVRKKKKNVGYIQRLSSPAAYSRFTNFIHLCNKQWNKWWHNSHPVCTRRSRTQRKIIMQMKMDGVPCKIRLEC